MGRRSINTTKSGKYMNPTDQARKEARKKELKKNKKQRQMVRAAVLKGKDPNQIIEEMEKIDQMEFNVLQPSPLNEKVLKDKRKKLRDTLDRVLKMYHKDDPDKWIELKRNQAEYERRRGQLVAFYDSVKHAQQVSVDEIPLPSIQVPDHMQTMFSNTPAQIPLPIDKSVVIGANDLTTNQTKPIGILKKSTSKMSAVYNQAMDDREPPGVPPGPPPELSSGSEEENDDVDDDDDRLTSRPPLGKSSKTLRFFDDVGQLEERSGGSDEERGPGQNLDEFMKELESAHKRSADKNGEPGDGKGGEKEAAAAGPSGAEHQETQAYGSASAAGLPGMMFRPPPPMRPVAPPMMPVRMPPGPPPGRPAVPTGPMMGLPPRLGIRLPPGPPPGVPPRMIRMPMTTNPVGGGLSANVLSAAPQLISRTEGAKQGATIMAKPQIRNLSADVTRFVPSALRVKRENKKAKSIARAMLVNELRHQEMMPKPPGQPTKDDAYMQFMKEMEGLL